MEFVLATNETLTLFSTLREICHSMTRRIDNFRGNPQQFAVLKNELSIAEEKVNMCRTTLEKYSKAIITESMEFEVINVRGMVQTLQHVEDSVDELQKKLPVRRGAFGMFSRANRNADAVSEQVEVVRDMSSRLNELNEKLKGIARENDIFSPVFPPMPKARGSWYLDFSTRDTVEGEVKAKIVESMSQSSSKTPNNYGHVMAVVGVAGMGGVGKTTALLGLAQEPDIREMFSGGGIYFLGVGKDASTAKLVTGLKEIVKRSGGKKWSERIDNNGSLESAVWTTSCWFAGRKALFMLDDLWQTPCNRLGYLEALMGITDDSPESHIVISTRSSVIASETSTRIEFMPREKMGCEARGMFLSSAGFG